MSTDELVLEVDGEGFSEQEEECTVQSEVKAVSTEDAIQYILLSDGLTGNCCPEGKIIFLYENGGTFEEVAAKGLQYMNSLPKMIKPIILISAGSKDITPEVLCISQNSIIGNEDAIKSYAVTKLTREIKQLMKVVKERNGILTVAPLLPCPASMVYKPPRQGVINNEKQSLANFLLDMYCTLNNKIMDLNRSYGMFTPVINSTVEETGTTARRGNPKPHKDGKRKILAKKIKNSCYEKNLVDLKTNVKSKMMRMLTKNLLHGRKNRWNMGYPRRNDTK